MTTTHQATKVEWAQSLDDAFHKAKNANKLVLIDFFNPH